MFIAQKWNNQFMRFMRYFLVIDVIIAAAIIIIILWDLIDFVNGILLTGRHCNRLNDSPHIVWVFLPSFFVLRVCLLWIKKDWFGYDIRQVYNDFVLSNTIKNNKVSNILRDFMKYQDSEYRGCANNWWQGF